MTPTQEIILKALIPFHLEQKKNDPHGEYFNPVTGGIFSGDLAPFCGLTWEEIEAEGIELEKTGHLKLLVRKEGFEQHGLQATDFGEAWYKGYLTSQEETAEIEATNEANAEAARLAEIATIETTLDSTFSNWDSATSAEKDEVVKLMIKKDQLTRGK